jgi:predicted nuclease of predicted toxin-antitoxin system
VRFLVDNQLPPALARFISQNLKWEALHVIDVGLRDCADEAVWNYASDNHFVLISKDEDFTILFSRRPTARLLWIRLGNCRRDFLLDVFDKNWPKILGRFESGERFVELR